jgi:hypothetical protein
MGVSDGTAVTSGSEDGSPQAMIVIERINMKDSNVVGFLNRLMVKSFFEGSISPLYKQAALVGRLVMGNVSNRFK